MAPTLMPDGRSSYRRRRAMATVALIGVAVVVVIAASSIFGNGSHSPKTDAAGEPAAQHRGHAATTQHHSPVAARPRRPRSYGVGIASLTLLEPSSAATADARLPSGAPARALPTRIRYPVARGGSAGQFPLIVFSQGFDYSAEAYSGLLNAWARAGYIVADPTFPRTDPNDPNGLDEDDILNHPADLRYVIGALVGSSAGSPWREILNPAEVAVAGQSDGGDVSLAVADNSCCRDPAVKAAVILSGAELPAFGGRYYSAGATPLLVVQGDADTINAPGCSAALYDGAPSPKYYLDLLGAEHLPPYVYPTAWRSRVQSSVIAFLDRYLKHEPGGLQRLSRAGSDPGVSRLVTTPTLPGASTYCPPTGIS